MHYYNENDPFPAQWLRNFIDAGVLPAGHVDTRSIADVTAADLRGYVQCHFFAGVGGWPLALRLAGVSPSTRLWTGSCPCQPFSGAGKRRGTEDDRHLWPVWKRLIAQCCPAIVLGEQVASADGRNWFAAVRADLEALGYAAAGSDLCAAGIGAPHIRQRIYFVGLADTGSPDLRGESGRGAGAPSEDEARGQRPERERRGDDDGSGGADGWLADTPGIGERADEPGADCGDRLLLARAEPGRDGSDNGADGGLADSAVQGESRRGVQGSGEGPQAGAVESHEGSAGHRADGWLADRDGDGRQPGQRNDPAARHGDHADAAGHHGRLADTDDSGPQGSDREHAGAQEREDAARHPGPLCAADDSLDGGRPGTADSFWGTADWLFCRDGKWRPVEPGTQPLAHGVPRDLGPLVSGVQELGLGPDCAAGAVRAAARDAGRNRVGRLRGYGNAIVPQLAATFIRAALNLP